MPARRQPAGAVAADERDALPVGDGFPGDGLRAAVHAGGEAGADEGAVRAVHELRHGERAAATLAGIAESGAAAVAAVGVVRERRVDAGGGAARGLGEGRLFRDGGHGLRPGEAAHGARAGPPWHPRNRLETGSLDRKRHQRLPRLEAAAGDLRAFV